MCSMGRPWCCKIPFPKFVRMLWKIRRKLWPLSATCSCRNAPTSTFEALGDILYGSHPTWHSSLNWGHCAKRNPQISVISVKLPGREAIGCDTESLLGHKQKRWLKLYNLVHFDSKLYSRFGNMNWVGTLLPIRGSYTVSVKLVTPKNRWPNTKNPRKTLVSQYWSVPNLWKLNPWWSMLKSDIIWIFGFVAYVTIW